MESGLYPRRAPRPPAAVVGAVRGPPRPSAPVRGSLVGSTGGGLAMTAPLTASSRLSALSVPRGGSLQPQRGTAAGYQPPRHASMPPTVSAVGRASSPPRRPPHASSAIGSPATGTWAPGNRQSSSTRLSAMHPPAEEIPLRRRFAGRSGAGGSALLPARGLHPPSGPCRSASLFEAGPAGASHPSAGRQPRHAPP